MSFVDMSEIHWNAQNLLATKPTEAPFSNGDYVRWEVEVFRRRYEKQQKEVAEAEAAFREACTGGTFTAAEATAHSNALRQADTQRSIAHASIGELVSSAAADIQFAKKQDEWISNDRRSIYEENPYNFCQYATMAVTLPNSPEAARNTALLEAEQELVNDMEEIKQDAREAGSGSGSPSAKRSVTERFEARKAAIEEEYYAARLARY